ncbi:permease prefix domain 1-containing protein [Jeotgalibacillus marinus]|uniref:Permease prefix domain 1-containing protein n=1 Tax=Jeotgalibacillus marinus TaxID=86667 RepID=A0ABV3Q749_9BACL
MSIQSYLDKVISFIELNPSTRKDLQQELATHFRDKKSYYQEQGFNEKEAEEKTKLDFGDEKKFAQKLNNAYFPFRNSILVSLSLISMLFSVIVSFSLLTFQQIFPYLWLTIIIGSSLLILYFVRKPSRSANHRLSLILLLIWLNILYFYGYLLMDGLYNNKLLYVSLVVFMMALMLISLSQILLGVIYQPIELNLIKVNKQKRGIMVLINIVTGIIVIGVSLVYIAGALIFMPEPFIHLLLPLGIISLWIIFVIGEVKTKKIANLFRVGKIVLAIIVLSLFLITQINL